MSEALSEKRILVVDDAHTVRHLVRSTLNEMGYDDIVEAGDGLEAMKRLEKGHFDLIISDWNMPRMNGLQLLIYARTSQHHRLTPFVMLTAEGQKDNVLAAIQQGATNYILKPFTQETLEAKLRQAGCPRLGK